MDGSFGVRNRILTRNVYPSVALRFAAACSYRASTSGGFDRQADALRVVRESAMGGDMLLDLVVRHRIQALAWDTLERHDAVGLIGDRVDRLREAAMAVRRRSLPLAMAEQRATSTLRAAGIECLVLKGGPDLSRRLYGDIGLRQCKDVDLVVRPERFADAVASLESAGWIPASPVWMSSPGHRWLASRVVRDFPLRDVATGAEIELHGRFERIVSPAREAAWWDGYVSGSGEQLSAAAFCYLCLHGALHCWNRMKWLGDIAALVERRPDIFLDCREFALGQELVPVFDHLAVLLRELFGIEPSGFEDRDLARSAVDSQVDFCLERMRDPDFAGEFSFLRAFDRVRTDLFRQSLLGRRLSLSGRLSHVAWSVAVRPDDVEALGNRPFWPLLLPFVRAASAVSRYVRLLRPGKGPTR